MPEPNQILKLRQRNKDYVDSFRHELFCEDCFTQEGEIVFFNPSKKNVSALISHGAAIKTLQKAIDEAVTLCRTCMLRRVRDRGKR